MYNIDTIPSKVYYKIKQTKDLTLLSDKEEDEDVLKLVWEQIDGYFTKMFPDKSEDKVFNLSKRIESFFSRYKAIETSINILRLYNESKIAKEILQHFGYDITDDLEASLKRAEIDSKEILDRIEEENIKLEKFNKTSSNTTFESALVSVLIVTGTGYVNPNNITHLYFMALIDGAIKKIKSLENGK